MIDKHYVMDFLVKLDAELRAGHEWVGGLSPGEFPSLARTFAINQGFVERRGHTNRTEYRITESGQKVLFSGEFTNGRKPNGAKARALAIREYEPVEVAAVEPCEPTACVDCPYQQALDIIANRVPEARDLVAVLHKINRINRSQS